MRARAHGCATIVEKRGGGIDRALIHRALLSYPSSAAADAYRASGVDTRKRKDNLRKVVILELYVVNENVC